MKPALLPLWRHVLLALDGALGITPAAEFFFDHGSLQARPAPAARPRAWAGGNGRQPAHWHSRRRVRRAA